MRWLFITCSIIPLLLVAPAHGADGPAPKHWSMRPRTQPSIPKFEDPAMQAMVRTPVDAFLLAQLEAKGLRFAPEADARTLIRRLTFDLTGLPPTPVEIDKFVKRFISKPQAAYEELVDRVLASPRYGERWGRHWLDVVRFAETEGFEYDRQRAGAWRFRDYVIDSFNKDKPFDRFVMEQLAGDEMEADDSDPKKGTGTSKTRSQSPFSELQIAAGFHRLGPVRRNAGNQELAFSRHEVLTEMTDIIGNALLGLTVGCARCHDHKFDRISQEDYYCLQAFLASTQERDIVLVDDKAKAEWKTKHDAIQKEIKKLQQSLEKLQGTERGQAEAKLHDLEKSLPAPLPTISTVRNVEAERTPIHLLRRGDTDKKDRQVGPRILSAFAGELRELSPGISNPRTALARWIVAKDNPLTARVMVNRIWQGHFGKGIVGTANDFGVNGSAPTHPELLDYLANEFVAGGWQIKPLHKMIVMSSAYRQASQSSAGIEKDEDNRLLWRFPMRRLNAEEVRDTMLLISGRLNDKAGGPSVILPVESDLVKLLYTPAQWTVTADKKEHDRRSVYLLVKRNLRLPFMEAFDQPDAQTSCAKRESSTHALQALELLNGRFANNMAESFAERLRREAGDNPERKVERAYLLAAGRPPTAKEKERAVEFLKTQPLKEFALAAFNLNGFLYVR